MPDTSPSEVHVDMTQTPPTTALGILRRIGPGLILAGSIVGSGELIATTTTGAKAGFSLLWLIIVGCVIKVFAQIEIGRYTIISGKTAMAGLNEVPGPRLRVNWILWYWVVMFVVSLGQLGGIVGGVGQVMTLSAPLTEDGRLLNDYNKAHSDMASSQALAKKLGEKAAKAAVFDKTQRPEERLTADQDAELQTQKAALEADAARLRLEVERMQAEYLARHPGATGPPRAWDDALWATLVTIITAVLLVLGRYGFVQTVSTVTVASFTVMTVFAVFALQTTEFAIRLEDVASGLTFDTSLGLATALATFGIIGVGANELISYPYWCLEKGYARFTGPRDDSAAWGERARGWMRVMHVDAWGSMVVYTFATLAFYLLGAAVLFRTGQIPEESAMIRTLSEMYVRPIGAWTQGLFLVGAFAVLYSTFFVAMAGHARVASDVVRVFGIIHTESAWKRLVTWLSGIFPFLCLAIYIVLPEPGKLVLAGGLAQSIMLPFLAIAAWYFRYRRMDKRLEPSPVWDIFLFVSGVGLMIAGGWAAWVNGMKVWEALSSAS